MCDSHRSALLAAHLPLHPRVCYLEASGIVYRLSRLKGYAEIKITELYMKAGKQNESRCSEKSVMDRVTREKPNESKPDLKLVKNRQPLDCISAVDGFRITLRTAILIY